MDGFVVLDTENSVPVGDKLNAQKAMKAASLVNAARQKLGDISNLPHKNRPLTRDDKSQFVSISANDHLIQLQKENKTLMKIIEDRTKLIEVTGVELKKLRINLQKMQQQNFQLAQSNSQLLAELNSGKDRLKVLQHALGCRNGLLKVKNLEVQEKLKVKNCKILCDEESMAGVEDGKFENAKRRAQSKSLGSSRQVDSKDRNDNKRPCTRRQSAKFEHEVKPAADFFPTNVNSECQPSNESIKENDSSQLSIPIKDEVIKGNDDPAVMVKRERPQVRRQSARLKRSEPNPWADMLEMPGDKFPVCSERNSDAEENGINSSCSSRNEEKEGVSVSVLISQESRRSSLNRPSRQAAKKIKTYKEVPINVKMRRNE